MSDGMQATTPCITALLCYTCCSMRWPSGSPLDPWLILIIMRLLPALAHCSAFNLSISVLPLPGGPDKNTSLLSKFRMLTWKNVNDKMKTTEGETNVKTKCDKQKHGHLQNTGQIFLFCDPFSHAYLDILAVGYFQ